jgi:two-component system, chemotaxis family, protein-glutamate methylesterase/glutaminase
MANGGKVKVVAIGASAGGVEALSQLVSELPGDLPAAVLVVLHVSPTGTSVLPQILSRSGTLPARSAKDGMPLEPGTVVVAPSDYHMIVEDGVVRLDKGPRENGHRPAIDPLMRSVAGAYGPAAAGVILSGTRDDGAAGLDAVKRAGGWALVQDPETALYPSMPANALAVAAVDACLPLRDIARQLDHLTKQGTLSEEVDDPVASDLPVSAPDTAPPPGGLMHYVCPECGGVMTELDEGGATRFVCRVGHRYTLQSLLDPHYDKVEGALWTAVRALEEREALLRRIAGMAIGGGSPLSAESLARQADDCAAQAARVRDAVASIRPLAEAPE